MVTCVPKMLLCEVDITSSLPILPYLKSFEVYGALERTGDNTSDDKVIGFLAITLFEQVSESLLLSFVPDGS